MLDDLTAHGLMDSDSERLARAFESFGRTAKRWPRTSDVIEHLPRRQVPLQLEAPNLSQEQVKHNLRMIREAAQRKVVGGEAV